MEDAVMADLLHGGVLGKRSQQMGLEHSIDFCYWQARSVTDTLVIIGNQCVVTYLLLTAAFRLPTFCKLPKSLPINVTQIIIIHCVIMLWGIAQTVVNFYSLVSYLKMSHELRGRDMMEQTHSFALVAAFPGFLVQTLFLTICVTFCRNLVREYDIRQFPSYSLKFVNLQRIYFYLRLAIRLAIISLIAACDKDDTEDYSFIEFVTLIVDSAIINFLLIGALRVFLSRLSHPNFKRLKREFYIMVACSICRIIIDTIYLILYSYGKRNDGWCISQIHYHPAYTVLQVFMSNLLMHLLPIGITLKVYRFDHREMRESEELIPRSISQNSDSFQERD